MVFLVYKRIIAKLIELCHGTGTRMAFREEIKLVVI